MPKGKKIAITISAIAVVLLAGLILFYNLLVGNVYFKFGKYDSPNDKYTIVVKCTDAFMFGPQDIKIKARKNTFWGNFTGKEYVTFIGNDGKNLDENNIIINWKNDEQAEIILKGEEQEDEILIITFGDKILIEENKCVL